MCLISAAGDGGLRLGCDHLCAHTRKEWFIPWQASKIATGLSSSRLKYDLESCTLRLTRNCAIGHNKEENTMSAKRLLQLCLILILLLVSFAATGKANAWSYCGSTYVVQRGDWLAKIARHCGVTLSALRAANPWTYHDRYIYPGQVLNMPGYYDGYDGGGPGGYSCGPAWDYYGSYYVVCRGDTLGGIAMYYGVTVSYLQRVNGIWNANLIYAGQIIRV
jgi:LysM repeat protein